METGQMNMIQLPIEATLLTTVTGSSQAQPAQAGEQDSSVFAAILGGMTPQAPAQSTVLAGAVPTEVLLQTGATVEAMPLVVMDVKPETLFTFLTTLTMQLSDKVPAKATPSVQLSEKVSVEATPVVQLSEKVLAEAKPVVKPSDKVIAEVTPAVQLSEKVLAEAKPVVKLSDKVFAEVTPAVQLSDKVLDEVKQVVPLSDKAPAEVTPTVQLSDKVLAEVTPVVQISDKVPAEVTPTVQLSEKVLAEAKPVVQLLYVVPVEGKPSVKMSEKAPVEATCAKQSDKDDELKQSEDLIPQEAFMNAAWEQAVQTLQMVARMPESGQNRNVQVDTVKNSELPVACTATLIAPEMPLRHIMEAYSGASTTVSIIPPPALTQEMQSPLETVASHAAPQATVIPQTEANQEALAIPQAQTVLPQAPQVPAAATAPVSVLQEAPAPSVSSVPEIQATPAIPSAKAAAPALPRIPLQQIMEAYSKPFSAASETPALAATVVLTLPEQRPIEAVVPETALVEMQSGQHLDTAFTVSKDAPVIIAAVPATQEEGEEKPAPIPLQMMTTTPEQHQEEITALPVQHAIETAAIHSRTAVKTNNGRAIVQEEQLQQQPPVNTVVKTTADAGNVFPGGVKAVAAPTTGEDFLSGDKSQSDQAMNGQVHQVSQQRIKPETVAAATPVVAVATSGVAEQVVKQVIDHFAKHEVKSGSEQIVLRLSPENLGELKVNLRMENQRLTVEIVTENRMVRDAILQNSDTLKDSLAKQNIKMDSFSVSSDSNSNDSLAGRNGRNQNEWQELTRNRQANQWLQSGYNLPKDFIPQKLAYNQQTEYGMLNVHF
jgi:flagellar hook-length control protein FliK